MKLTLYGEPMEYGYGIEVYRDIRRDMEAFVRSIDSVRPQFREIIDLEFDEYFNGISKMRDQTIGSVVEYAVGILYQNGLEFANEEDFCDKYSIVFESFYDDISPLVEKCSELERQYQVDQTTIQVKKMGRSYWSGGGFGIKGAIKGAVTAKAMNVGMDIFRNAADARAERKVVSDFTRKRHSLLRSKDTVDLVFDSIGKEIRSIAECIVRELVAEEAIEPFKLETAKARALLNNTLRYNSEISTDKLREVAVRALRLDPFCKEVYDTMFQFESDDTELMSFAKCFDMISTDLVENTKKNCASMPEDNWKSVINKIKALQEMCKKYEINDETEEIDRLLLKLQNWYLEDNSLLEEIYRCVHDELLYKSYQGISDLECYREYIHMTKNGYPDNRKIMEAMKKYVEIHKKYNKDIGSFTWMTVEFINPLVNDGDMSLEAVVGEMKDIYTEFTNDEEVLDKVKNSLDKIFGGHMIAERVFVCGEEERRRYINNIRTKLPVCAIWSRIIQDEDIQSQVAGLTFKVARFVLKNKDFLMSDSIDTIEKKYTVHLAENDIIFVEDIMDYVRGDITEFRKCKQVKIENETINNGEEKLCNIVKEICKSATIEKPRYSIGESLLNDRNYEKAKLNFGIGNDEDVYLIYDDSLFKTCKIGFSLSTKGIRIKTKQEAAILYSWNEFVKIPIKRNIINSWVIIINKKHEVAYTKELYELLLLIQEAIKKVS